MNPFDLFSTRMEEARQPKKTVLDNGMIIYTLNGKVHRTDGPAIITSWSQEWFQNGIVHRDDGPAMMYKQHPYPRGDDAIKAGGKNIAQWHIQGEYIECGILTDEVFDKYWHKGE
jgi:hypothetical protein